MIQLLISVTSIEEAQMALENGADIIDLKDPSKGALGALPLLQIQTVVDYVNRVKQDQVKRLRSLLARLDASRNSGDMDLPGLRLHTLQGELAQHYAVCVSGNWRLIFRFDNDGNATDVNLVDYH